MIFQNLFICGNIVGRNKGIKFGQQATFRILKKLEVVARDRPRMERKSEEKRERGMDNTWRSYRTIVVHHIST